MDNDSVGKLRWNAEHCRRLARSVNDERSINALQQTAREFDTEADRLESEPDLNQLPRSEVQ
jgi:hypothetical protein